MNNPSTKVEVKQMSSSTTKLEGMKMSSTNFTPEGSDSTIDVGMCSHKDIKANDVRGGYTTLTFRDLMDMAQSPVNESGLIELVKPDKSIKQPTLADWHKATAKKHAGWFTPSTLLSRDGDKQTDQGQFVGCGLDFDEVSDYFQWLAGVEKVFGKLVYVAHSSSKANQENQKMRVLVPFNRPIDGKTFKAVTQCMFDDLTAAGLKPDACMKETNRVFFLPYHGELYYWTISTGGEKFGHTSHDSGAANVEPETLAIDDAMLFDPLELYSSRISSESVDQAEIDRKLEKAVAAERRRLQKESAPVDTTQPIDWFNASQSIAELLLQYGYDQRDRKHKLGQQFRRPGSTSGSFSGIVFDNDGSVERYFTLSPEDALADPEGRSHSPYSVYKVLVHGGNHDQAIKEVAKMMRQLRNVVSPTINIEVTDEDRALDDDINEVERVERSEYSGEVVQPFRGVMTDLTEGIIAASIKPQPTLAAAGALAGMAAGIPHQYCLVGGSRIALYSLILAPTSTGKNDVEQSATKIATDCGSAVISGGYSSGQGVEDHIKTIVGKPHLMHMPEAAHVLQCYSSDSRSAAPHITFLFSVLLELSNSRGTYKTRLLANTQSVNMPSPSFNFLAASTPEKMGAVITPENISEGLINRLLFFIGDSKPRINYDHEHELRYTDRVQKAMKMLEPSSLDNIVLGMSPDAKRLRVKYGEEYDDMGTDDTSRALFGRSLEKVMKVAGTLAVWDVKPTPVIEAEHMEYAKYYVDLSNRNLVEFKDLYMFGSELKRNAELVLRTIQQVLELKKAKSLRATEWALIRTGYAPRSVVLRHSNLEAKELDDAIYHLSASGKIEEFDMTVGNSTKKTRALKLA